jgi:hypothetical protein
MHLEHERVEVETTLGDGDLYAPEDGHFPFRLGQIVDFLLD